MNKHKVCGELMKLREDIKEFEDVIRDQANHDPADLRQLLQEFATRIYKVIDVVMEDAPAHDHLQQGLSNEKD